MAWERVEQDEISLLQRIKIDGGWLYKSTTFPRTEADGKKESDDERVVNLVFVPEK